MAQQLGALFINAALAPVSYAGTCIMAQQVKQGLNELTAANLLGGVMRGIETVSAATGLPRAYISSLLPMDRVQGLGQRIAEHQLVAAQQWDVHAGHIGGLMGVANLTDDGRPPNTIICLQRLAAKMSADKALAVPLKSLAEDLDRWHALVDTCRAVIDDGSALRNAYLQKRILRIGLAVALLLAIAATVVWWVRVSSARSRINVVLSGQACEVDTVDEADLGKATDEQLAAIDKKKAECEEEKRVAREVEEKRIAAEQRKAEMAKQEKERAAACKILADSLEANDKRWSSLPISKTKSAFFGRIAVGRLIPNDVSDTLDDVPCLDTDAAHRIGAMYGRAIFASAGKWMAAHIMSPGSSQLVVKGKGALGDKNTSIFAASVERMATSAVNMGDKDALTRVFVLCKLIEELDQPKRQMCRAAIEHAK